MRIAILIATYGDAEWKELAETRALPSAQAQEPAEILIGHQPEGSIAASRNGLAERATEDWLCFLDADDELASGYLAHMRRAFEELRPEDGTDWLLMPSVSYVQKGRAHPPRMLPMSDLRNDNFLVIGTLVTRDLFMRVGGFSDYPHGFEDWSLWAKCWKAGAKIKQVRRAVYIAHVNQNSKHRQMWRDRSFQVETHNRVRQELFPDYVPEARPQRRVQRGFRR